jgi:hypothetical protein
MNKPKLVVGITQGDSNGIGYEVLIKSLADSRILDSFTPVVYGSPRSSASTASRSMKSSRWTPT